MASSSIIPSKQDVLISKHNHMRCPFKIQDPARLCHDTITFEEKEDKEITYIYTNLVEEFVKNKEPNPVAPTTFYHQHTRPEQLLKKPRAGDRLSEVTYWCVYGPGDTRRFKNAIVNRTVKPKKGFGSRISAREGGPSKRRGCCCHIIAKKLYLWPELTQITYYSAHVDKDGHPCHGLLDESSVDQPSEDRPWLSNDMK
jgi:hypothetical protein